MKRTISKPILITILVIIAALGVAGGITLFIHNKTNDRNVADDITVDVPGSEPPYNFDYSWTDTSPYIAHALGGILDSVYTNSYEAFLLNYNLGQRLFEADFNFTENGDLVLLHSNYEWINHIAFS